jgi:phi13 family phage major tail protein
MADTTSTTVTPSKVRFGISKLYFAKMNADGTFEKPWPCPGAESVDLSSGSGDKQIINADNKIYYSKASAGSKQLDITVARFPRDYYTKLLGQKIDTETGGLVESPDDIGATFACMYEISGDQGGYRSCFLGCTSSVPTYSAATNTESSISEAAEKATLSASAVTCKDGKEHTVVTYEPGDKGYDGFFDAVPLATIAA